MNVTEDREFPTDLVDLRDVPLAEVRPLSDNLMNDALLRILPEGSAHQVTVAAFNSSI